MQELSPRDGLTADRRRWTSASRQRGCCCCEGRCAGCRGGASAMRLLAKRRLTRTALAAVSRSLPLQRFLPFAAAVPPPATPSTALAAALSAALTTEFTSSATATSTVTSISSPSRPSLDEELSSQQLLTCELNSQQLLRQLRRSLDKLLRECFPPRLASYGSYRTSRSRINLKKSSHRIAPPFLSNNNSAQLSQRSSNSFNDSSLPTLYNPITEFSLPSLRPVPKISDTTPKLASESFLAKRKHLKEPSSPRPKARVESSSSIQKFSSESSLTLVKPVIQSSLPSPKLVTENSVRTTKSVSSPLEQRHSLDKVESNAPTSEDTLELFHSYIPLQSSRDLGVTGHLVSQESSYLYSGETSPKDSSELDPPERIESCLSSFRSSLPILGLLSAAVAVAASRLPLSWLRFPSNAVNANPEANEGMPVAPIAMSPDSPSPPPSTSHSPPLSISPSSPPSPHSPSSVSPSLQSTTPPYSETPRTSSSPSASSPETPAPLAPALELAVTTSANHDTTPTPSTTVVPWPPPASKPLTAPPSNLVPYAISTPKTNVTCTCSSPVEMSTPMTIMTATIAGVMMGVAPASSVSTLPPHVTRSDATTLTESWTATPWGSLTHVQPAAELAARAEVLAAAARMAAEGVVPPPGPSNAKEEPVRNEIPVPSGKSREISGRKTGTSPETVVLLAPRELQDSQHAPPLRMKNSSWRRLAKACSRSSSGGRTSTGTVQEPAETKTESRSSSSDRLAPQLLHSLPAPLLTRILTKNFAGVEMAALRGACRPLHLAGSCALRSSLWSLRRDLEVRAVRLQVALRRVQSAIMSEEQTVGPPTEGVQQSAAQEEARMLLISLILLEEVRGELDVLAAHASAWPQAGASSRLVGLLAGSVLDEGRRLLRLLPFPYRPQPPSRASRAAPSKMRRHRNKPHGAPSKLSQQLVTTRNSHTRIPMPSLGAASAADAVCSFSARLSEMLATEATVADFTARRVGGAAAAALGSCALALLEHCACADAMMVVTVGGGDGSSRRNETVSGNASGDSLSQLPDLHPDTVQVLAVYEVRALEEIPPPWPPAPDDDGRRRSGTTEPPAAMWLRTLGKAVRQQRRRVASARVEAVYGRGSTDPRPHLGAGIEGEPHRRSQLVALPGGGARHLLERRWPSALMSHALPGRSVRVMMELRCGRASAPPVLRPLLSPLQPSATPRNANANPSHDPGAFAFFAWRTPDSSHRSNYNCTVDKKD